MNMQQMDLQRQPETLAEPCPGTGTRHHQRFWVLPTAITGLLALTLIT